MHMRFRKLDKEGLKVGDHVIMIAEHGEQNKIITKPGVLEYWDGLAWWPVKFSEADDKKDPYDL